VVRSNQSVISSGLLTVVVTLHLSFIKSHKPHYWQIGHFPLIWATVKVWITELTLIHKNIRSVSNSHAQELTLILKIISQCAFKHILTSLIKTIMPVLKILTYIITSITARPVRLAEILAVMSVSTFKTAVILYVLCLDCYNKQYRVDVEWHSNVDLFPQLKNKRLVIVFIFYFLWWELEVSIVIACAFSMSFFNFF
jgi:hypothetical protein